MEKIYNLSRKITSLAKQIEYELTAYNPGTSRTPLSIIEISDKCIGLQELFGDLIDRLDERLKMVADEIL